MKHLVLWALVGSVVSCAGGTETDNPASPLAGFESSACKTKAASPGPQALVLESDVEGLQCVEWEQLGSDSLRLRLLNFPAPCGEQYLGRAATGSDGALEVSVYKDTCDVFRCGTCVFDFDYELSVTLDEPLELRLGTAICASKPTTFDLELMLPVDTESSGITCRALEHSALEMYGRARGTCGQRNMPCGDCNTADVSSCTGDLVCTTLGDNDARCLVPCASNDECTAGVTTCLDGVCQAATSF